MVPSREECKFVETGERLKAMMEQQVAHYVSPDYLAPEWQRKLREATEPTAIGGARATATVRSSAANNVDGSSSLTSSASSQITEVWREKICEWCYQVVDHFDFNREVVSVAMSYLDRYLATRTVNRRIFQLAAMTALYLAIKLFEPGKLRMSSLIDLSRGYFMAEHIVTMEDSMLQSLKWMVHPPTSFAFVRDFMCLVSPDIDAEARHDVSELSRFMTELSVCDYRFVTKKPSSVALASIILALDRHRVHPNYKEEFINRLAMLGTNIGNDEEVMKCHEHLTEMYEAGDYNPTLEDAAVTGEDEDIAAMGEDEDAASIGEDEDGTRVATISPTGVADGPDADESSQMECA